MKKITLIGIVATLFLFAFSGCTNNEDKLKFIESKYTRDDVYASSFNTYYTQVDGIELHIIASIFDETVGVNILSQIKRDYNDISKLFSSQTFDFTIYIVEQTDNGEVFSAQNKIFCTLDDITSGAYRRALVKETLNIAEPWQIIGLALYIWDDTSNSSVSDSFNLQDYYKDENNISTLSLFVAYFNEAFVSEDTLAVVKKTAYSITEYILNEYGVDSFLTDGNSSKYRQEWLNSISLDDYYYQPYDLSYFDGASYSSTPEYPLIININNHIFYINYDENHIKTPEDIMEMLNYYQSGMENILEYIEDKAPQHYPQVLERWKQAIYYYCDADKFERSGASITKSVVYIERPADILHETVHILLPGNGSKEKIWISEGLTTSLSIGLESTIRRDLDLSFDYLTNDQAYETLKGDDKKLRELVKEYYFSKKELPTQINEFDLSLFNDSFGIATLTDSTLVISGPEVAITSHVKRRNLLLTDSLAKVDGILLTYPESSVFVQYLIEKYGLDTVLEAYFTNDSNALKSILGKTYNELLSEFKDHIISEHSMFGGKQE